METLVDACGSSLESLSLPACPASNQVKLLEKCQALQEVVLRPIDASDAAKVLEAIPESVCRLAVRVEDDAVLSVVDRVAGTLKQLRSVMLCGSEGIRISDCDMKDELSRMKVTLLDDVQEFRMLSRLFSHSLTSKR